MTVYSEITTSDNRSGILARLLCVTRKRLTGVSLPAEDASAVESKTPPEEDGRGMDNDAKNAIAEIIAHYGAG